jgi:hypothetical protein
MVRKHEAKAAISLALGNDGQQRAPTKTGSIPITRSRQPSKSPVITDGAFSFLAFE